MRGTPSSRKCPDGKDCTDLAKMRPTVRHSAGSFTSKSWQITRSAANQSPVLKSAFSEVNEQHAQQLRTHIRGYGRQRGGTVNHTDAIRTRAQLAQPATCKVEEVGRDGPTMDKKRRDDDLGKVTRGCCRLIHYPHACHRDLTQRKHDASARRINTQRTVKTGCD